MKKKKEKPVKLPPLPKCDNCGKSTYVLYPVSKRGQGSLNLCQPCKILFMPRGWMA